MEIKISINKPILVELLSGLEDIFDLHLVQLFGNLLEDGLPRVDSLLSTPLSVVDQPSLRSIL